MRACVCVCVCVSTANERRHGSFATPSGGFEVRKFDHHTHLSKNTDLGLTPPHIRCHPVDGTKDTYNWPNIIEVLATTMATTDDNGASRTTNAAGTMTTVVMETTIPTETEVKKDGSMTSINNHHEHSNNKGENNEESRDGEGENYGSSSPATAWELFVTLFLPFVIDMFKYIMLGTVHFVQLSLGVVQQYIERSCGGVNSVNKNIGGTAGGIGTSVDPHEWPQQFLTALGVLTVFALVIHPDGFTWVVVGKIRCVE